MHAASRRDEVAWLLASSWGAVEGEDHARRLVDRHPGIVRAERDPFMAAQAIAEREFGDDADPISDPDAEEWSASERLPRGVRQRMDAAIEMQGLVWGWALDHGGHETEWSEPPRRMEAEVNTAYGPLTVSVHGPGGPGFEGIASVTVFARFDEPDRARVLGGVNPHSGKWNHHYPDDMSADEAFKDWLRVSARLFDDGAHAASEAGPGDALPIPDGADESQWRQYEPVAREAIAALEDAGIRLDRIDPADPMRYAHFIWGDAGPRDRFEFSASELINGKVPLLAQRLDLVKAVVDDLAGHDGDIFYDTLNGVVKRHFGKSKAINLGYAVAHGILRNRGFWIHS
jgi:hypothetical protein